MYVRKYAYLPARKRHGIHPVQSTDPLASYRLPYLLKSKRHRVLQRHFSTVDLVEQNPKFLEQAKKYLGVDSEGGAPKIGNLICSGLQDYTPREGAYDVIWCQWVLGHLTDDDLVAFFKRAK